MSELTAEAALKLVGRFSSITYRLTAPSVSNWNATKKAFAALIIQPVGSWAQASCMAGVIASALNVAAGTVCVGSTAPAMTPSTKSCASSFPV